MVTLTPFKHSPEEDEGEQPWTIHFPGFRPTGPEGLEDHPEAPFARRPTRIRLRRRESPHEPLDDSMGAYLECPARWSWAEIGQN